MINKIFGTLVIATIIMLGGVVVAKAQIYNTGPNNQDNSVLQQRTDQTVQTDTGNTGTGNNTADGITDSTTATPSTPGIPDTGGGGSVMTNILAVIFAALIAIWGGSYITKRISER